MSDDPFLPPRLQALLLLSGLAILVWFAVLGWQQYNTPAPSESASISASTASSISSKPATASQEPPLPRETP